MLLLIVVATYAAAIVFSNISRSSLMRLLERREALTTLAEQSMDAARSVAGNATDDGLRSATRVPPADLLPDVEAELSRRMYDFLSRFDAEVETARGELRSLIDAIDPVTVDGAPGAAVPESAAPETAMWSPRASTQLVQLSKSLRAFASRIEEHAARQMFAFQAYFYFVLAAAVLTGFAVYGLRRETRQRRQAAERRRHLSRELIRLRDEQNRTLSTELHDTIAQELYSARLAAEQDRSEVAARRISSAVNMVRRLSHSLHGIDVTERGLTGSLQDLVTELSSIASPQVDLEVTGIDDDILPHRLQHELYHIAREAAHNAIRHANARHVQLRLTASHPNIVLVIRDDGRGFDTAGREHSVGIGLTTLEERAESVGGSVTIESSPGRGTRVRAVVSVEEKGVDEHARSVDR